MKTPRRSLPKMMGRHQSLNFHDSLPQRNHGRPMIDIRPIAIPTLGRISPYFLACRHSLAQGTVSEDIQILMRNVEAYQSTRVLRETSQKTNNSDATMVGMIIQAPAAGYAEKCVSPLELPPSLQQTPCCSSNTKKYDLLLPELDRGVLVTKSSSEGKQEANRHSNEAFWLLSVSNEALLPILPPFHQESLYKKDHEGPLASKTCSSYAAPKPLYPDGKNNSEKSKQDFRRKTRGPTGPSFADMYFRPIQDHTDDICVDQQDWYLAAIYPAHASWHISLLEHWKL